MFPALLAPFLAAITLDGTPSPVAHTVQAIDGTLTTAAGAVLVAVVTTCGTVFTAIAARKPTTAVPATLPPTERPATAPGSVAAYYERALGHAERELDDERAEIAGLRVLLSMAVGYARTLIAHDQRAHHCHDTPAAPAGLDIDVP